MPRRLAIAAASIAALGVVACVLVPLVPAWPFVLLEHFRFQYVWIGILVIAACGALRIRYWFDAALIATLVNALWVLPDLSRTARPVPTGTALRILVLNVHTQSTAFAEVRRLIGETHADIVGLVEVDEQWLTELAPSLTGYPHRIEKPEDDNFGVALYSTRPVTGGIETLGSLLPTVVASVDLDATPLTVVLTHPIPPVESEQLAMQVSQLDTIAARVRSLPSLALVMGDLNATPWSWPFRNFVAASGLCDTRAGFGLQASFPAATSLLRIPIDHILVSCAIGVKSREIGPDVGSDHLPVIVDLVVPRS